MTAAQRSGLELAVARVLRASLRDSAVAEAASSLSGAGSIAAAPTPLDEHTVAKRSEQVWLGRNTVGYMRYVRKVPRRARGRDAPATPDPAARVAKRRWDATVRTWRRALHAYDLGALPPAGIAASLIVGCVGRTTISVQGAGAPAASGEGGGGGGHVVGGFEEDDEACVGAAVAEASTGVYRLIDGSYVAGDMLPDECAFVEAALIEG